MTYTVVIDEAGDLGENGGTRYFIISAVIIENSKIPIIISYC